MVDFLYNVDLQLFLIINNYISNPVFNFIFTFLHQPYKNTWFILIVLSIWLYFIYQHKKNRLILILIIPIGIITTDKIGHIIKNMELRERPYMTIESEKMHLLVKAKKNADGNYKETSSSKKSFPSNHSANIFFLYFIISTIYPNQKKYFLFLALIVALSRIYIGVHYPFDIISGAGIGIFVGFCTKKILIRKNIIR